MRQACLNMIHELARADERVVFVGSDLGAGVLQKFRDEFPERFFMEGVSEAAVTGMAAGMALEGKIVYVNTLAVFLTRRVLEQVALDACLHNLKVRFIGNGGGMVYAPLGPTHMATDDIALMRVLPNMTIVAPADAEEMKRIMPLVHAVDGPVYIRLGKGGDPIVSIDGEPERIGQAVRVREGADALLLTTGITLKIAREAADFLAQDGIEAGIIHCPTIKPLDIEVLAPALAAAPFAISIEEHSRIGGFGSAIAELLSEMLAPKAARLVRVGLPDEFPDHYGSQADLLRYYGIAADRVVDAVERLRGGDGAAC